MTSGFSLRTTRVRAMFRYRLAPVIALAGGALLLASCGADTARDVPEPAPPVEVPAPAPEPSVPDPAPAEETEVSAAAEEEGEFKYPKLVGRWLRPDGGYILEIRGGNSKGSLDAGYFNPQPIKVSQALVMQKDNQPVVMVELRDTGYPGCVYSLTYDRERDALFGTYYQAAMQREFEVFFVREEPAPAAPPSP